MDSCDGSQAARGRRLHIADHRRVTIGSRCWAESTREQRPPARSPKSDRRADSPSSGPRRLARFPTRLHPEERQTNECLGETLQRTKYRNALLRPEASSDGGVKIRKMDNLTDCAACSTELGLGPDHPNKSGGGLCRGETPIVPNSHRTSTRVAGGDEPPTGVVTGA